MYRTLWLWLLVIFVGIQFGEGVKRYCGPPDGEMRQTSESPAGSLTLKIGSVGGLLKEALYETVHTVGVREPASKAMLFGHVQIPLQQVARLESVLRCVTDRDGLWPREHRARRRTQIFDDAELDKVITRMLRIDPIERTPAQPRVERRIDDRRARLATGRLSHR